MSKAFEFQQTKVIIRQASSCMLVADDARQIAFSYIMRILQNTLCEHWTLERWRFTVCHETMRMTFVYLRHDECGPRGAIQQSLLAASHLNKYGGRATQSTTECVSETTNTPRQQTGTRQGRHYRNKRIQEQPRLRQRRSYSINAAAPLWNCTIDDALPKLRGHPWVLELSKEMATCTDIYSYQSKRQSPDYFCLWHEMSLFNFYTNIRKIKELQRKNS